MSYIANSISKSLTYYLDGALSEAATLPDTTWLMWLPREEKAEPALTLLRKTEEQVTTSFRYQAAIDIVEFQAIIYRTDPELSAECTITHIVPDTNEVQCLGLT